MKLSKTLNHLIGCLAILMTILPCGSSNIAYSEGQNAPSDKILGYADHVSVQGRALRAVGWAVCRGACDGAKLEEIELLLDDKPIYQGRPVIFPRNDVARQLNDQNAINSGWNISANLNADIRPGKYSLKVIATFVGGIKNKLSLVNRDVIVEKSEGGMKEKSPIDAPPATPQSRNTILGSVDGVGVTMGTLYAKGWAVLDDAENAAPLKKIEIWLNDRLVYDGSPKPQLRPDVSQAFGRPDWTNSGWQVSASLLELPPRGMYKYTVVAYFANGQEGLLSGQNSYVRISETGNQVAAARRAEITGRVILFLGIGLLVVVYILGDIFANSLPVRFKGLRRGSAIFAISVISVATLWVGFGLTGSSLAAINLAQNDVKFVGLVPVIGKARPIRSDEYAVFTPEFLAQLNARAAFPLINENFGDDGLNMLIPGGSGMPVKSITSFAKPAVWGAFFLPLRQAIAWLWWIPLFGSFLAIWWFLTKIIGGSWRLNAATAISFVMSSYVVAWSNTPAYVVGLGALGSALVLEIFESRRLISQVLYGAALGLTASAYFLVLYPPWQILIAYVFAALLISTFYERRRQYELSYSHLIALALALTIVFVMLWAWWVGAKTEIIAIANTVYPGQRAAITGGNIDIDWFFRGLLNWVSLYDENLKGQNQSEIASFPYLILPMIMLFAYRILRRDLRPQSIAAAIIFVFIFWFMAFGLPLQVAKITLLSRVLPARGDLALGFLYILLIRLLLESKKTEIGVKKSKEIILVAALVIVSSFVSIKLAYAYNSSVGAAPADIVVGITAVAVLALSMLLLLRQRNAFIYLNAAGTVAANIFFNPVIIAPTAVVARASELSGDQRACIGINAESPRILVIGSELRSQALAAAGQSVTAGVFWYPEMSLWGRLDPTRAFETKYNRYQHLRFIVGHPSSGLTYEINSPQDDVVDVVIEPKQFNFRLSGAGRVLASTNLLDKLSANPTLCLMEKSPESVLFAVRAN